MQTALEQSAVIGKQGTIAIDSIRVSVYIQNAKTSYGTARYLVTPVSGSGSQWVNADRVQIMGEEVQS